MGEGAGDGGGLSQGVKPGALTALLQELAAPEGQGKGAWESLRPGMVLGRFELLRELGRGGFGVVWEARDQELGRSVAFELIRPGRPEADADKLHREAEGWPRLHSPLAQEGSTLSSSEKRTLHWPLSVGWPSRQGRITPTS